MRSMLRSGLESLLHYSGAAALYARLRAMTGATILMYHSVATDPDAYWVDPPNHMAPEVFERHLQWLKRNRNVVSLDRLVEHLQAGEACPRGSVVLTFDDGYLDTLRVAAPLLASYGLPAILYLPTAYIDRAENHWADVVHGLLQNTTAERLEVAGQCFELPMQRGAARAALHARLLPAEADARRALLEDVAQQLGQIPEAPRLTMNWDEVHELQRAYPLVSIGAHTVEHIDLRSNGGLRARYELAHARAVLHERLDQSVTHVSFPYGRASDESLALVTEAGYTTGIVSADLPLVRPGADLAALPRIEAPVSLQRLALWTGGGHPYLQRAMLGKKS